MNVLRSAVCCLVAAWGCSGQTAIGPYVIDTVAGSSNVGDGGLAALAPLGDAEGICIDRTGNVYIADSNDHRVRKIAAGGMISTVVGTGFSGSGNAQLSFPYGLAVDAGGNLFIADLGNNRIQKVDAAGVVTTVLGGLSGPRNIQVDAAGNLYISEFTGHKILKVSADGVVTTLAGTGSPGSAGSTGDAQISYPAGLALAPDGSLYFADSGNNRVRRIAGGQITTVLGTGDPGADAPAQLNVPTGLAVDAAGNLYVADSGNQRIRKLTPSGVVSTVDVPARDVAVDNAGNIWAANGGQVHEVLTSGVVALAAGDGSYQFRGDGDAATSARLNGPSGVAADANGTLWIADQGNQRIRRVTTDGIIGTAASGLTSPGGLALDGAGDVYIADINADQVQRIDAVSGALTAVPLFTALLSPTAVAIGSDGTLYIADTANNRVARAGANGGLADVPFGALNGPRGVAVDGNGNIWVADTGNNVVRKMSPDGRAKVVADQDQVNAPRGLAVDSAGNLWIADTGNHRVRVVAVDGSISTVAGKGGAGFAGDGGHADAAQLNTPMAVSIDGLGRILIADFGNNRVRRLTLAAPPVVSGETLSIGVVNAASLAAGPVAPGSIVSIFGTGMGAVAGASGTVSAGLLDSKIGDTRVLFDGAPAALFYANAGQINAQVPFETAGHATTVVEVFEHKQSRGKATINIVEAAPAFFTLGTGTGPAVALNEDGRINSLAHPAGRSSIVTLYATGLGQTSAGGVSGRLATAPLGYPLLPVAVTVGFYDTEVLYAGDAPGFVGLTQINIRLPGGFLGSGILPLTLSVGTFVTPAGITLAIQ